MPPSLTVAPERKFAPVIVTEVPPAVLPVFGDMDVTVGAAVPPPLPSDLARIVVSFLSAPGELFK
jgi:hypothetical protein